MRFATVCSGIEAASVAWKPLGWKPVFYSEIEAFPRHLLKTRHPEVPLFGDFTAIRNNHLRKLNCGSVDLLAGGTPCQSFSIAGLGKGYDDERGNLTLEFIRLIARIRPRWVVWENVAGVLSNDGGRAFASFLGGLAKCGYGFAYRVLDAQYFGVPQQRRRVVVVGHLGNAAYPAKVLFEPESLRGDITPRRSTREKSAADIEKRLGNGREVTGTLMANCGKKLWLGNQEAFSGAFHVVETPVVQLGHTGSNGSGVRADVAYTLEATNSCNQAICVNARQDPCFSYERSPSLTANDYGHCLYKNDAVRRLIPKECERLQGFEDDYTNISGASDSARYKAIGNSWAVPKFAWLGQRIDLMEKGLFQ